MKKICVIAFMALGMLVRPAAGAGGDIGAEFLLTEVSAATAALAAGQAALGGSAGMFRNPASILGQEQPSISFTHFTSFGDTAYEELAGLYPNLLGGSLAARAFYSSTYNFSNVDEFGHDAGTVDNSDMLLHVAYARNLLAGLASGLGVKTFESTLAGYKRTGAALDLGLHWQSPWSVLALGASVQNIGAMSQFDQTKEDLPLLLNSGIGCTFLLETEQKVVVLADFSQPLTGEKNATVSTGIEYNWHQLAFVRGGYRFANDLGAFSAGVGIIYKVFGIDYTFQPLGDLGVNHRITISYLFPKPQVETTPPLEKPTTTTYKQASSSYTNLQPETKIEPNTEIEKKTKTKKSPHVKKATATSTQKKAKSSDLQIQPAQQ